MPENQQSSKKCVNWHILMALLAFSFLAGIHKSNSMKILWGFFLFKIDEGRQDERLLWHVQKWCNAFYAIYIECGLFILSVICVSACFSLPDINVLVSSYLFNMHAKISDPFIWLLSLLPCMSKLVCVIVYCVTTVSQFIHNSLGHRSVWHN